MGKNVRFACSVKTLYKRSVSYNTVGSWWLSLQGGKWKRCRRKVERWLGTVFTVNLKAARFLPPAHMWLDKETQRDLGSVWNYDKAVLDLELVIPAPWQGEDDLLNWRAVESVEGLAAPLQGTCGKSANKQRWRLHPVSSVSVKHPGGQIVTAMRN